MPVFATLFGAIATSFVTLFSTYFSFKVALKLAAYTTWMVVFTAFLGSVYVCINSLYSMVNTWGAGAGGGASTWVRFFWVGLGMFVPSNAGAVIACISSVWIATAVYKVQKQGMFLAAGG